MPLNILLADDSVPAQNMGKKILTDAGYSVVTVSNGLEALRKIGETVPDIAILDIFMPGYTGLEICKRLRSSAATANIPVILTVGKLEPYRPEDGEQVQSNAVIVKPFASTELISAVRSLVGGPETQAHTELRADSNHAAIPEPPAVVEEAQPDEAMFGNSASRLADVDLTASPAISAYGGDFLLSGAEPNNPANLAFDPDSKHTPFSASAIDLLASGSQTAAGNAGPAFGEFDLAADYSEPATGRSAAAETPQEAEFQVTPGAMPSASLATAELEAIHFELPPLDPMLETTEDPASLGILDSTVLEVGEVPEKIFSEFAPLDVAEAESTSAEAPLSPEEEARRAAFEALFNSPEPIPLDHVAIPDDLLAPVAFDGAADPLHVCEARQQVTYEMEPEPAADLHLTTAGVDMNPLADPAQPESDPLSAVETDPEPQDELLAPVEWLEPEIASKPEETMVPASDASDLPHLELPVAEPTADAWPQPADVAPESSLDTAPPETAPAEAPQLCAEVHSEPLSADSHSTDLSAYEPGHSDEILQAAPELECEASQACPEALLPEVELTEAAPLALELPEVITPEPLLSAPELSCPETDLPLHDAGPVQLEAMPEPFDAPLAEAPDAAPLHDHFEALPVAAEAAGVPVSMPEAEEPIEQHAEYQTGPSEQLASPTGVSSRLHEAERIHHAIELVFDRFKPLLVAAIVRELARQD